jgi:acyl-coenzyme A thioesterase PaaI-like protein
MSKEFRNISKVGYMLHNGGLEFKKISDSEYEYRTTLKDFHMNAAGVTHGGYIMSVPVTITLDIKFIAGSKPGEEIIGFAKIKKQTRSLIFMQGELTSSGKTLATAEGIWKIL